MILQVESRVQGHRSHRPTSGCWSSDDGRARAGSVCRIGRLQDEGVQRNTEEWEPPKNLMDLSYNIGAVSPTILFSVRGGGGWFNTRKAPRTYYVPASTSLQSFMQNYYAGCRSSSLNTYFMGSE